MSKYLYTFILLLFSFFSFSQEKCLSHKLIEQQISNATTPQDVINEIVALKNSYFTPSKAGNIICIPVVFHIIHNGDSIGVNENLSDSIIKEQLKRINTDFRAYNMDTSSIPNEFKSLLADIEIQFCLAKKEVNGNFTTGIVRHFFSDSTHLENDINNTIKPATIWDRNNYLNIWTAMLSNNNVNGYATPPLSSTNINEDGIVLNYAKVGNDITNDIGRTLVHEIGHWLGLFHIWGDDNGACTGDDGIADTPNQADSYGNCPSGIPNSCSSNDMYVNYMDYTDDECSLMFTEDQKNRMNTVLNGFRLSILSSTACTVENDLALLEILSPNGTICQNNFQILLKVKNLGTDTLYNYSINIEIDNQFFTVLSSAIHSKINPNETKLIKSSFIELTDGLHSSKITITNISNEYEFNNELESEFSIVNTGQGFNNLSIDFENDTIFPPNFSHIENFDNDTTWSKHQGTNNHCIFINNSPNTVSHIDNFITTDYKLVFFEQNISLTFDYLYRVNGSFYDTLTVYYSADCGINWIPFWQKSGLDLSNNETANYPFLYNNEAFINEEVSLYFLGTPSSNIINPKIRFKFENKSAGGNNLYLDNILFKYYNAIEEIEEKNLKIYPNPTTDLITIVQEHKENLEIAIIDISGKTLLTKSFKNLNNTLSIKHLSKGIYYLKIVKDNTIHSQKILKF